MELPGELEQEVTTLDTRGTVASDLFAHSNGDEELVCVITEDGDLLIERALTENGTPTSGSSNLFEVSESGSCVATLDEDGDLVLKKRLFAGGSPDRSSSQGE